MAKNKITITKLDGALGVAGASGAEVTCKIGVATGAPALLSAVTKSGTTPPTITIAGVPIKDAHYRVEITTGGAAGTALFRWSDDDGASWRETGVAVPAGGGDTVLGVSGITITWPTGTYNVDNVYVWTAKAIPVKAYASPDTLKNDLTSGPLVESGCDTLEDAGGTIIVAPIYPSTAGASGSVKQSGSGPAVTLTGAPNDDRDAKIKITKGGARGTATFAYSLDAGDSYSGNIATAATYLIPGTGVTLNFATGTYVKDETYSWHDDAPKFSNTDLAYTIAALVRSGFLFKLIEVVGLAAGASDAAKATALFSTASACETHAATLEGSHQDTRFLLHAPDIADAALVAAAAGVNNPHVMIAAGFTECISAASGRTEKRSFGFAVSAMFQAKDLSIDLSCPDANEAGPIPARYTSILRDEDKTDGLDDARFIVARTWTGSAGFFVSNPWTFADPTSDYSLAQNGLVIDEVSRQAYAAYKNFSSARLRTNKDGTIEASQAEAINNTVSGKIGKALGKNIVGAPIVITDETINLLSTRELAGDARVQPYGYPKTISIRVGFTAAA